MSEFLVSFLIGTLLLCLVCYLLIRTFLRIIVIKGTSMYPTLSPGDRVLVLRHWPARRLRRGHILIGFPPSEFANNPKELPDQSFIIKRVTGLPGDTLITFLSDLPDFERPSQLSQHNKNGQRIWHIPAKHIFVKGDSVGTDSLTWGPLSFSNIVGIVLLKLPRKQTFTYTDHTLLGYREDEGDTGK